jgi:hypothetical protein
MHLFSNSILVDFLLKLNLQLLPTRNNFGGGAAWAYAREVSSRHETIGAPTRRGGRATVPENKMKKTPWQALAASCRAPRKF